MSKKKAYIILSVVVALVIIGLAIFYFFFRGSAGPVVPPPDDLTFPVGPDIPPSDGITTPTGPGPEDYQYYNRPQEYAQRLRLISSLPVSGATLFDRNAEVFIRYVERANGHVYEAKTTSNDAPYRISNTTIPKIYEALWVQNGDGVILRYLKDGVVQTFYAALDPESDSTTERELTDGTFLPADIDAIAVSPAEDKIFYITKNSLGSTGARSNPNGTSRAQLFTSPAREWSALWETAGDIVLYTKPSANIGGYAYVLDASTGKRDRLIGETNGLTVLPNHDGTFVLFSKIANGRIGLNYLSTEDKTVKELGVSTLPEKCLWSAKNESIIYCAVPDLLNFANYPDSWYQGVVSFTDNLWKINIETGETTIILNPPSVAERTMDITNLTLDDSEQYLLFTNKKDLSLWLLDLSLPL